MEIKIYLKYICIYDKVMAEGVISVLFNTINNYLIDLGLVSKTVGEKALDKIKSSARQSIFSSLQDYAKQGSTELDEKLEKLKLFVVKL